MPDGEADRPLFHTGVVASVVDRASGPANRVSNAVSGMLDRLGEMRSQGQGVIQRTITDPLSRVREGFQENFLQPVNESVGGLDQLQRKLIQLGTFLAGFFAFREIKQQLTEIFEQTVELESQLVDLANRTGSERFSQNVLGWARDLSQELGRPREQLFGIAEGLAEVGINATQIDTEGILAAGDAIGSVDSAMSGIMDAVRDPQGIFQLNELFNRQLPFERLRDIVQRFPGPGEFRGRFQAINQLLRETFGENLERSAQSVEGLRNTWDSMMEEIRMSIMGRPGDPDSLFSFIRTTMDRAINFVEENRGLLHSIGSSVGDVLRAMGQSLMDFFDHVLETFGVDMEEIRQGGEAFRRELLIPLTAEIIGMIERMERFAEGAFDVLHDLFSENVIGDVMEKATRVFGLGATIIGVITRSPSFLLAGATALGISEAADLSSTPEGISGTIESAVAALDFATSGVLDQFYMIGAISSAAMQNWPMAAGFAGLWAVSKGKQWMANAPDIGGDVAETRLQAGDRGGQSLRMGFTRRTDERMLEARDRSTAMDRIARDVLDPFQVSEEAREMAGMDGEGGREVNFNQFNMFGNNPFVNPALQRKVQEQMSQNLERERQRQDAR